MLFWIVIPDLRLISFTNPFLHIVFLFLPYCFHRFWTCTELSRHWHLFVLVSCARLSWTHSAFESTLKTLLSYRTVFLILRFVPPVNWTCVNYIAVSRVWWHLLSLLVCLWTWLGHFIGESLIITVPKHCCQKTTNTVGTHMTQHVTYVIVFFQKLHPKEVFLSHLFTFESQLLKLERVLFLKVFFRIWWAMIGQSETCDIIGRSFTVHNNWKCDFSLKITVHSRCRC